MTRKEELQEELNVIQQKEMAEKLKEMEGIDGSIDAQIKKRTAGSHINIMYGDFAIKLVIAMFISIAFIHIVYTGNVDAMNSGAYQSDGNFQLLSVVGPMFGAILQYYFGKNKSASNGE